MSLALDADDLPQVAVGVDYGFYINYLYQDQGIWIREYKDGVVGSTSLDLGSDGQPRISYNHNDTLLFTQRKLLVLNKQIFLPVMVLE